MPTVVAPALATAKSYERIGLDLWRDERPDVLLVYVEGVDRNRDGPDILQQAPYLETSCRVSAKTGDLSLNIAIFHRMGPLDLGEVRSKFSDNPQDFWVSLLLGRSLCSC